MVGPSTELVEPVKETVNSDHIYSKNLHQVQLLSYSSSELTDLPSDTDTSTISSVDDILDELFPQRTPTIDNNVSDLGSDGNRSPMSDTSSDFSPNPPHDHFDLDDTFNDLFPQLIC